MNLRALVSPGLYGGGAAAVVAAVGYALAASQSFPLALAAFAFTFGGLSAFSILAGAISRHGNAENPEVIVTQNNPTTPPETQYAVPPASGVFLCRPHARGRTRARALQVATGGTDAC